tara:strand:- start:6 stop:680 length:675 start_codon:yes stop_codon:yes gene_type:complete
MFLLMSALFGCVKELPDPIIVEKTVVEQTYIDECECDTNCGCVGDAATPDDSGDSGVDTAASIEPELQFDPDECRNRVDYHACNINLMNQDGDRVDLYDYYGSVIVLDLSAMWCYPCQQAAYDHNDMLDRFRGEDIVYITVLLENFQRETPSQDDLIAWRDQFEIASPILQGRTTLYGQDYKEQWPMGSYPSFIIIDKEMLVYYMQPGYNPNTLDRLVTEALAR